MLVLSRNPDEAIVIGDNIKITVVKVNSNGSVRIGIDAPKDVRVDREEVAKRKLAGNGEVK